MATNGHPKWAFLAASAKPDIVALIDLKIGSHSNFIAIENERTLKSKERLKQKLDQYANRTLIDGVIYVCANDEIVHAVELMYRSKRIKGSLRIEVKNSARTPFLQPFSCEFLRF